MVDGIFEQSSSATHRLAAVRAAATTVSYQLPSDVRQDLEQEALLELWRKRPAYDPRRGSWRTFCERVVANKMTSIVRRMRSERSGQFREDPLDKVVGIAAPDRSLDLRSDVSRVLTGVSRFDRRVALCLICFTAIETSHNLGVSRATVYRAIERLRTAFVDAGLANDRQRASALLPGHADQIEAKA